MPPRWGDPRPFYTTPADIVDPREILCSDGPMKTRLLLLLLAVAVSAQQKQPLTHETLWMMKRVGAPVPSPDGKWVLWQVWREPQMRSQAEQLLRAPISGGVPEPISQIEAGSQFSCARLPSTLCVLAERTEDRRQVILHELDPLQGRGAELLRFDLDPNDDWSGRISPEGSRFAVIAGPAAPIRVLSLRGQSEQIIPTKSWNAKQLLRWSANGKGFFITNAIKGGSQLLHMDMRGNATILRENDGGYYPWGLQSPDGKRLAVQGSSLDNNIWLMENFSR